MNITRLFCILLTISFFEVQYMNALKCKTDDGPSDSEMKRVARSCMRKLSNDYNRRNQDYSDEDDDESLNGGKEPFRVRNRDQLQIRTNRHNKRSAWDRNNQQQNENRYSNQRNSSNSGQNQGKIGTSTKDRQNKQDKSCAVHCFFEELNMLNKEDYPDRHKVLYVITRDIRDNELREFYVDVIQECFRFLELQPRMEKCQFSKGLISCMTQHARSNCDDWHNHTMIFN